MQLCLKKHWLLPKAEGTPCNPQQTFLSTRINLNRLTRSEIILENWEIIMKIMQFSFLIQNYIKSLKTATLSCCYQDESLY